MEDIGKERRIALACLARYYIMREGDRTIAAEIREAKEPHLEVDQYNEFFRSTGPAHAAHFYEYLNKKFANEKEYNNSPEYIKRIINLVYDFKPNFTGSIADIIDEIVDTNFESNVKFSEKYNGSYNTYRYSAGRDERRRSSPTIVISHLEIFPLAEKETFSRFRILYHSTTDPNNDHSVVDGVVMKLKAGGGLIFFGYESHEHPLIMVTGYNESTKTPLFGSIIRKRKVNKNILLGKIMLIRSNELLSEAEIIEKIGIYTEKEMIKGNGNIENLLKRIGLAMDFRGKRSQVIE